MKVQVWKYDLAFVDVPTAVFSIELLFLCVGEKGSTVLSTKPVILVCDLSVMPNEVRTCMMSFFHLFIGVH